LLHAMRSPFDTMAEPGTFTEGALDALSKRNVYLALGHGHRRTISAGVDRPARFVAASPGSLEYIHETDFHLEDPRGAILVDVLEDGSFSVMPKDTLKRPRCVVRVDLGAVALPEDVVSAALARCREAGVPEGAILGVILEGTPSFARAQVPVPALERRLRDELAPISVEVRFEEDRVEVVGPGSVGERGDDVASTLELVLAERAPGADKAALARLAAFVGPRVGDGGVWRATEEGSELEDTLALLLDVVAGSQAAEVRDVLAGLE